jgi:hypothetical protein
MSDQLYFSRDTKMYVAFKDHAGVYQAAFEIPVLDGFGFSQANNTSEITLSEMESSTGTSRRGRRLFNDSLAPAEWNCSTYIRPFKGAASGSDYTANEHHAVEEVLWGMMAGADHYDTTTHHFESEKFGDGSDEATVTESDGTDLNIAFTHSNRANLNPVDIFFVMETSATSPVVYKIADAVVNEATINFEVDGIATVEWSGFGKDIKDVSADTTVADTAPSSSLATGDIFLDTDIDNLFHIYSGSAFLPAKDEGTASTSNFIRNRVTTLTVAAQSGNDANGPFVGAADDGIYNLTLTGGSVTITNNIEFLTPETLGSVNLPLENVTGARSITGTLNCYVVRNTTSNVGTSSALFNDMKKSDALALVNNDFSLVLNIGGTDTTKPRFKVNMPTCHLEIPTHSIEDVISFETNFHALGSNISAADEIDLTYFGA